MCYRYKVVSHDLESIGNIYPFQYEVGKWMDCPELVTVDGEVIRCPFFIFEYEDDALAFYNVNSFSGNNARRLFKVKFKNSRAVSIILSNSYDYHHQVVADFWNNKSKIIEAYGSGIMYNTLVCEEIYLWEEVMV